MSPYNNQFQQVRMFRAVKIYGLTLVACAFMPGTLHASTDKKITLGDSFSAKKTYSVQECTSNSALCKDKKIKLTGIVAKVCQSKGCWFELKGNSETSVRITSLGYKFFVPKDTSGMLATVEGVFEESETPAETAQHFEDDRVKGTSEKPKKITMPIKEFKLAATSVELKPK
jgi:hypothetical protein